MTRTRQHRRRRAFTLVEMIITIGIVVFLTGLTVSATTALARRSEVRKAETTLHLLDTALGEWEIEADRKLSWGDGEQFDLHQDTAFVFVLTELLEVIRRSADVEKILATVTVDRIYTYDALTEVPRWVTTYDEEVGLVEFNGSITILDGWGTPIYATHPGRLHRAGDSGAPDPDGTIRTPNELQYGVAANRRVCFISAGPDQLFGIDQEFFGLLGQELEMKKADAREDNVFSYTVTFD